LVAPEKELFRVPERYSYVFFTLYQSWEKKETTASHHHKKPSTSAPSFLECMIEDEATINIHPQLIYS
jgi:hypothetical protein